MANSAHDTCDLTTEYLRVQNRATQWSLQQRQQVAWATDCGTDATVIASRVSTLKGIQTTLNAAAAVAGVMAVFTIIGNIITIRGEFSDASKAKKSRFWLSLVAAALFQPLAIILAIVALHTVKGVYSLFVDAGAQACSDAITDKSLSTIASEFEDARSDATMSIATSVLTWLMGVASLAWNWYGFHKAAKGGSIGEVVEMHDISEP
jgi:hypothetical protein